MPTVSRVSGTLFHFMRPIAAKAARHDARTPQKRPTRSPGGAGLAALPMTPWRGGADAGQSRSNSAIDSTCEVCGNMLMTPAPRRR
jgi:hypothetical protein